MFHISRVECAVVATKPYSEKQCLNSAMPLGTHRAVYRAPISHDDHCVLEERPLASEEP